MIKLNTYKSSISDRLEFAAVYNRVSTSHGNFPLTSLRYETSVDTGFSHSIKILFKMGVQRSWNVSKYLIENGELMVGKLIRLGCWKRFSTWI